MDESMVMRKNGVAPAAFLEKLYDIMENSSLVKYISWQPDGLSFLIKDVQAVTQFVLPHYFKHNNIQSFVRQLNMYNFTKTRHDSNFREFRQPLFQRGKRHLLSLIKRKSQVPADKNTSAKRKYNSYDVDYESRYHITTDYTTTDACGNWDGDDEGVEEDISTSSSCSSDNGANDWPPGRDKELDEIKFSIGNIEMQMSALNERYIALSASYAYLHEKFNTFQTVYPCNKLMKFSSEKSSFSFESLPIFHSKNKSLLDPTRLTPKEPIAKSQGPLQADLALRSCSHLSDSYLTLPVANVSPRSSLPKDDYLSKLLGNANLDLQARPFKRLASKDSDEGKDSTPGFDLDTMATAASIRLSPEDQDLHVRNSLSVLIDAASCRSSSHVVRLCN